MWNNIQILFKELPNLLVSVRNIYELILLVILYNFWNISLKTYIYELVNFSGISWLCILYMYPNI